MVDFPVVTGSIQNPYKQFTFTIAPQQIETVFYDFNFFRIISITGNSPTDFAIRFGMTGSETTMVSAGIGYELSEIVRNAQIRNTSAVDSITITVAVAIGRIFDDRLNVSGTIVVTPATGSCFDVKNCTEDDVNIPLEVTPKPGICWNVQNCTDESDDPIPLVVSPAEIPTWNTAAVSVTNSSATIIAANSSRESVAVQAGTGDLYVSTTTPATTANSFKIPANASHTFTHGLAIYGIRASAGALDAYYSEQVK